MFTKPRCAGVPRILAEYMAIVSSNCKELEALTKAGYTPDEIDQVYFGNWLRDFSQVIVASTVGFNEKDYNKIIKKFKNIKRNFGKV